MTYVESATTNLNILTIEEVRSFLKISHSSEDALLNMIIKSAQESAELFMERDLLTTTWINYRESFFQDLTLRRGKYQSVELVEYLEGGVYKALDPTEYDVRMGGAFGIICGIDPPTTDSNCNAVKITFKTGFGDDATFVPDNIKLAMLQHIGNLYESRGDCESNGIPESSKQVYSQYKLVDIVGDYTYGCL